MIKNIKDQKFGKLTAINMLEERYKGNVVWLCKCECGQDIKVTCGKLRSGHTRSCGCLKTPQKNLTGIQFHRLIVLQEVNRLENCRESCWLCKCGCGSYTVVPGSRLRNKTTQSCGCLQKEIVKDINSIPNGEAAFNRLYRRYKQGAFNRNLAFSLTKEEFKILTKQHCYYCDCAPKHTVQEPGGKYIYNGIDRIDNIQGYTLYNTITSCKVCNFMKGTMSQSDFIEQCVRIQKNIYS